MCNTHQASQIHHTHHDEHILVVKRTDIFATEETTWQGMKAVDPSYLTTLIHEKKQFLPRSLMETDPCYKQIIPYLVFKHNDTYFLMQRQAKASETRLQSKFSLGIGGHIRHEDMQSDDIVDWARREFHEEVNYKGTFTVQPLGILNDDSNPVGQVHVGFVYLLEGDSATITVHEELKSGTLYTLDECMAFYDRMEPWSQIVIDFLRTR